MGPHEAMDAETVAALLGVSTRQLNNYINLKGLPSQGSGKRRTFVWAEVLQWYVGYRMQMEMGDGNDGSEDDDSDPDTSVSGRKEDIRAATLRKTKAEANLKELELSKRRREVVVIADVAPKLNRMFGNLRSNLLSQPRKLADIAAGERDANKLEARYKGVMEDLCREISTGAIIGTEETGETDETKPGSLEEVSAAAEIDAIQAELAEGLDDAYVAL